MNLSWLTTLRKVADSGSFTKAAESLFLSQPGVSQQIRQLERLFHAKLIERDGRSFHLTEAGKQVYELAYRIEADIASTSQRVQELTYGSHTLITVVSAPAPLLHRMPAVLNRFWEAHPKVSVKTMVRFGPEIPAAVKLGIADIGIHSGAYLDDTLEAVEIGVGRLVCICAPTHPLASSVEVSADAVAGQRVAITAIGTGTRQQIDTWLAEHGAELQNVLEVSSHEEILIATLRNQAIGFVGDTTAAEEIKAGRVIALRVTDFDVWRPGYVTFRKDVSIAAQWLIASLIEDARGDGGEKGPTGLSDSGHELASRPVAWKPLEARLHSIANS
jgi:DNA-binding transcriptional LysR family regulator